MEGYYEVYLGNDPAGKVQIQKQGLYYRIICRCIVPKDMVYRLYAVSNQERKNLGVVIPEGDGYILERRIPVKQLSGYTRFMLSARSEMDTGKFIPIYPEEPFSYIVQLENAFLEIQDSQLGVWVREKTGAD